MIQSVGMGGENVGKAREMFTPIHPGPAQRQLIGYWQTRCDGSNLPHWRDIDPLDIPHLLSHVWIAELSDKDGMEPVYRLAGTEICQLYGGELRGKKVGEALSRPYTPLLATALRDAFHGVAAVIRVHDRDRHPDYNRYECVLLPVRRADTLNIIGLTTFSRQDIGSSLEWINFWETRILQHDTASGKEWWLDPQGRKHPVHTS